MNPALPLLLISIVAAVISLASMHNSGTRWRRKEYQKAHRREYIAICTMASALMIAYAAGLWSH